VKITFIRVPNYLLYNERLQIPLGILYLSAYLKQYSIRNISICDLAGEPKERWPELIPPDRDIYGLSLTTGDIPIGKEIARVIKSMYPKSLVIIGGAHISALPEQTIIEMSGVDVGAVGEGEQTMLEIAQGKDIRDIDGLVYRVNGYIQRNRPRAMFEDLDKLPFPDWGALTSIFGQNLVEKGEVGTCITGSRGCMARCFFCANYPKGIFRGTYRCRSPENIVEEARVLKEDHGVTQIRFVDEIVGINKGHLEAVADGFDKLGITWRTHIRANMVCRRPELMQYVANRRCMEMAIGVEQPHPEILKKVNKGITTEQCTKAVQIIKDTGMQCKTYFIIGLPGESWETIEFMKRWVLEANPDKCTLSTFCPLPGSTLYEEPEKHGLIRTERHNDWKLHFILGYSEHGCDVPFICETEHMNNEELVKARTEMYDFLVEKGYKDPPPENWEGGT